MGNNSSGCMWKVKLYVFMVIFKILLIFGFVMYLNYMYCSNVFVWILYEMVFIVLFYMLIGCLLGYLEIFCFYFFFNNVFKVWWLYLCKIFYDVRNCLFMVICLYIDIFNLILVKRISDRRWCIVVILI